MSISDRSSGPSTNNAPTQSEGPSTTNTPSSSSSHSDSSATSSDSSRDRLVTALNNYSI